MNDGLYLSAFLRLQSFSSCDRDFGDAKNFLLFFFTRCVKIVLRELLFLFSFFHLRRDFYQVSRINITTRATLNKRGPCKLIMPDFFNARTPSMVKKKNYFSKLIKQVKHIYQLLSITRLLQTRFLDRGINQLGVSLNLFYQLGSNRVPNLVNKYVQV